jgi:16S rRNA processing protein RimM
MPHWQLAPAESGEWQSFSLVDFRAQGKSLIARFAQIDDRTAAEAIKGWWIGASRETLPPLTDDEFYWNDLIGLTVENEAGEILGEITALIETGANDVLRVIGQDETERLIPFVDAVVKAVDLSRQRVRVAWETDW